MGCGRLCGKAQLLAFGVILGIWNNISTLINAKILIDYGLNYFAALTLFFLFFPGIVTSIGFLILHFIGNRRVGKLPPLNVLGWFLLLLFLYPLLPITLCIYTLITGKRREIYDLLKLFEGFLDDGPQFILRLIVVVLYKIGLNGGRVDVLFIISMMTSFGGLVFIGLRFNERKARILVKLFLCFPMFSMVVIARGFTMAVLLKEVLDSTKEWIGGLVILVVYILINIGTFKWCGQDWIRSVVFGLSSLIIPAGYNNDEHFYQRPHQELWGGQEDKYEETEEEEEEAKEGDQDGELTETMAGGTFLIIHTVINTFILSGCTVYLTLSRDLDDSSSNALIIPQILTVIPGCFFSLARAMLLPDIKPSKVNATVWKIIKVVLTVIFGCIAYGALIPGIFWTFVWKFTDILGHL